MIKDIFYESGKLSLLRITFILLMVVSLLFWITGNPVQEQMFNLLLAILAYLFGQKVVGKIKTNKTIVE